MSPTSLFTQVVIIIIAVAIGVMYINPTIAKIKTTQDSTGLYQQELEKIADVNAILAKHVAKIDSVPFESKQALLKYVPDGIDELVVMKNIQSILEQAGLEANSLAHASADAAGGNNQSNQSTDTVTIEVLPYVTHSFTTTFKSTYEQLKSLFAVIELSDYVLEINSLKVTPAESGLVVTDMTLHTFSRPMSVGVDPAEAGVVDTFTSDEFLE